MRGCCAAVSHPHPSVAEADLLHGRAVVVVVVATAGVSGGALVLEVCGNRPRRVCSGASPVRPW